MRQSQKKTMTAFKAGMIAIIVVVVATYLGTTKDIPFTKPYELKAVFTNATNLKPRSPVRIAGVEVGKVHKVEARGEDSTDAVVTMKIQKKGLPIHKDATLKIRPRIFLEGNFFVDLRPGTASSPEVDSGHTIPVNQTSAPVQIDQVLGALKKDAREELQDLLKGYGEAIAGEPSEAEDRDQDPDTKGETAGRSLNDAIDYGKDAFRGTALVNEALLGTELHDLSKLIAGQQQVFEALVQNEDDLKDLITNFNLTTAAFADEQENLRRTIAILPPLLETANPALDNLNEAFPPTRAFAREILPGVRETPETIEASFPWIRQVRGLVSPAELQGLVNDLRPAVDDLARTTDATIDLLPQVDLVNRCFIEVILPTGDKPINDGFLSTGLPNYKEFWQAMVALSSESQNFDGNGQYTRFQPGGGSQSISTGEVGAQGKLFGNAILEPLGTQPKFPGKKPPYNRTFPCHRNTPPNLDDAPIGAGP